MELDNMSYAGHFIQEELVSVMSLCMVNNTATNKSCVSHQQVVINFIRDYNTYYPYDRISITRESVFRLYFYRWRVYTID